MSIVHVDRSEGLATITGSGDLDFNTRSELAAAVAEAFQQPGLRLLVIDLRQVTFLDSSGVANGIMEPWRRAKSAGIECQLLFGPAVQRMIDRLGLGDDFS